MNNDTTMRVEPLRRETNDALGFKRAVELAGMIRDKQLSSVELTRYFIGRIERFDGARNAVVVRDFAQALEAAERADAALAGGEALGPLHGLPLTVKEAASGVAASLTQGHPGGAW